MFIARTPAAIVEFFQIRANGFPKNDHQTRTEKNVSLVSQPSLLQSMA
jgi:hypothetical protein